MRALVRYAAGSIAVPPAQFIHQVLEARGQVQDVGTQALLQPFAYGVADRPAGLVVKRFDAVSDSAHDGFRLRVHLDELMQDQVMGARIVSRPRSIACILVKIA